jgi:hypothetical protein
VLGEEGDFLVDHSNLKLQILHLNKNFAACSASFSYDFPKQGFDMPVKVYGSMILDLS